MLAKISDLTLIYDQKKTDGIRDISFDIPKGKVTSILGPSGSGKTTTLECLAGIKGSFQGKIEFKEDVQIAYVNQFPKLDETLSVFDNLELTLQKSVESADQRTNQIRTILAQLEITNEINSLFGELSGGQKQRVVMANALILNPTLLLLDEPFANLDPLLRSQFLEELFELFEEKDMTIVWVTHNIQEALAFSHQIALLNFGKVQQVDTPKNIYQKPQNLFSAQFFSDVNLIPTKIKDINNEQIIADLFKKEIVLKRDPNFKAQGHNDLLLVIHPEHILISENGEFSATVENRVFFGAFTQLELAIQGQRLKAIIPSHQLSYGHKIRFSLVYGHIHYLNEV